MRGRTILVAGVLLILQSALRPFFYYEAVYAGVQLLQPMPPAATMRVVNSANLARGLVGLAVVPGFLMMTGWGFWGTIALSVFTVVFDGVSSATVSFTAFAGLILPVVFVALLLAGRATTLTEGRGP